MELQKILDSIEGLDKNYVEKAQRRLDSLTKPLGSLGVLEDIAKNIVGMRRDIFPSVSKKVVIIMCADNGVYDEGVSSCPKEVTSSVAQNFTKGITGINIFAEHTKSEIVVVDIGIDDDISVNGILNKKIRNGTWNIAKGPAMTREEAIRAICVGVELTTDLKNKGYNLLATGEMGIGNTTTSSAITAVLTGSSVENVTGKGAGLSDNALQNKIRVINEAIEVNKPNKNDPIDVLSKVGGFDIAGLVGCYIGAAYNRIPIVIDGFISGAAALVACEINPKIKEYIIPSHASDEPGIKNIMEKLQLQPMLNLKMRLGEGTGAALAFHIIDAAITSYTQMGTFEDAEIEQYVPQQ